MTGSMMSPLVDTWRGTAIHSVCLLLEQGDDVMRTPSSFLRESLRSSRPPTECVSCLGRERDYVSTISVYSSASTPHPVMDYVVQDDPQDATQDGPQDDAINGVINGVINGDQNGVNKWVHFGGINEVLRSPKRGPINGVIRTTPNHLFWHITL